MQPVLGEGVGREEPCLAVVLLADDGARERVERFLTRDGVGSRGDVEFLAVGTRHADALHDTEGIDEAEHLTITSFSSRQGEDILIAESLLSLLGDGDNLALWGREGRTLL